MKNNIQSIRGRRWDSSPVAQTRDMKQLLEQRVVGQTSAVEQIVPYIEMHQAGLAPENRPVGVFLLLGPTGTGKTRTVEALADMLHGSEKSLVRVDCGEFQMEHEVAKLIGAPPGYLGHRETQPMLTQAKLNAATSENSNLSIILFDEVEKAAGSLARLLLGVLDKATLRLGDNNTVNFDKSLIFLTSNLGAEAMARQLKPWFGFEAMANPGGEGDELENEEKLRRIGIAAVRRKFSPEFVNRLDVVLTYRPLTAAAMTSILEMQLLDLQQHIIRRLGARAFRVVLTKGARQWLLRKGTSIEYGARELKRTILRNITQPLAAALAAGRIEAGSRVSIEVERDGEGLRIVPQRDAIDCDLDDEDAA